MRQRLYLLHRVRTDDFVFHGPVEHIPQATDFPVDGSRTFALGQPELPIVEYLGHSNLRNLDGPNLGKDGIQPTFVTLNSPRLFGLLAVVDPLFPQLRQRFVVVEQTEFFSVSFSLEFCEDLTGSLEIGSELLTDAFGTYREIGIISIPVWTLDHTVREFSFRWQIETPLLKRIFFESYENLSCCN